MNNEDPAIPIETHDMATKIEYKPIPWYLTNGVIDLDTGEILYRKDLMQ